MELFFLILLVLLMATALGSGFPVAFALPGSAIVTIAIAAASGWLFAGTTDAYFALGGPSQWLSAGVTNFRGVYWEAERDTLIAIPLFVFMGIMLQRSKIAEDLLVTMATLFGPVPGGLGISVVFVGALLAATTGIVGATVVAMGLISLPAMLRSNYSVPLATGTIAASGTLGQIIPPSIVLIILADQLASAVDQAGTLRQQLYKASTGEISMPSDFGVVSTSAGEMFLGAFIPGLLLVGLYMLFILGFAIAKPHLAPSVHTGEKITGAFLAKVAMTLIPPLALIFLVLGSIIAGVATVNQAGAIGAAGAMVMAGYRLRDGEKGAYRPATIMVIALIAIAIVVGFHSVNVKNIQTSADMLALVVAGIAVSLLLISLLWSGWRTIKFEDTLRGVMIETAKTSSLVFIILIGAAMLTAAFRAFGGEELVRTFLQGLPGGFWMQFFIVMLVIFILGFFLDFIEIAVVVVPIVAPILLADPGANVTAVWLGVMIGLNIQTSFLTPPFGFALFYLRGVAPPTVRTISIYKGVIAFIGLQILALCVVGFYPALVNYLPNRVSLMSETAPPPKNPRLQYCMEEWDRTQFADNGDTIRAAIATAKGLDLSVLPEDLRGDLSQAIGKAGEAMPAMDAIVAAQATTKTAAVDYRPLHDRVREIERDIRRLDKKIDAQELIVRRSGPTGIYSQAAGERAAQKIEDFKAQRAELNAQIPAEWKDKHTAFSKIQRQENITRLTFRRTTDQAYEPLQEILKVLRDTDAYAALADDLKSLEPKLDELEPAAYVDYVEQVRSHVGDVEGASDVRSDVNAVRKAMRSRTPDKEAARAAIAKTMQTFEAGLAWRRQAEQTLLPKLETYEAAIRDTIGLRGQPRLPRDQALFVAACSSGHRDVSLSF
ncbi:tripartite ATP-independent transporter DctM subunit [Breoghania corrubedonensis]|uniref:Tripartite ATP-independent transporter DctM subunit n=1 Tax=Breoghania corrubedonensis TaxID=665038 RepID=A0A2T5V6R2_9HYPH|nr:TRAP transporter large permease subunit [Breoghania corrubedonensis]PTW59439.1 tripartite ATP-independent transporter DctM subunit [Breoghania corrubedonensis]